MQRNNGLKKARTSNSRGRPRGFDSEDILDRAVDLFWQLGYADTTTRELENSLLLNQSSLYNSFGTKIDFYAAVLDRYELLAAEALLAPIEEPLAGLDDLDRFFDTLLEWICGNRGRGCMLLNTMSESCGRVPLITERTRRFSRRIRSALETLLERTEAAGELASGDNAARASLLLALILGLNIAARAESPRAELQRLCHAIQDQIGGWRPRPGVQQSGDGGRA